MPRYVWTDQGFVNRATGERMAVPDGPLATPYVVSDIPDYHSPIDGRLISGRAQRRYDLESNNAVPYEPSLSPTKGRFKNKAFCEKHGIELSEEYR